MVDPEIQQLGLLVNCALAAEELRVHFHGHHIPLVPLGFILYTGLGAAPLWFLDSFSY